MRLVVFDLDGTLVDSRQDLADSVNAVLESYGAAPLPLERVVRMVGEGARVLVQRALDASGLETSKGIDADDALARFHRAYEPRLTATTQPYPGISDMVNEAAGHATLAVLTNKPLEPSRRLIETFGWSGHFVRVIGGDGPTGRKPDPAGLLSLIRTADASPERTLMVGDSMVDVETARRAGTAMCVARYGFGNARGDMALNGDEWLAESGHDVWPVITRWMAGLGDRS